MRVTVLVSAKPRVGAVFPKEFHELLDGGQRFQLCPGDNKNADALGQSRADVVVSTRRRLCADGYAHGRNEKTIVEADLGDPLHDV